MIKRVITAFILVPLIIYIVLKVDFFYVKLILMLISSLAYGEWLFLDSKTFNLKKSIYFSFFLILAFVFLFYRYLFLDILFIGVIVHLLIGFVSLKDRSVFDSYYYFGGIFYVFLYFFALDVMKFENGRLILLLLFVSIWSGDSFAYFIGKAFGKYKLAPTISPKKTIEGAIAGIIGGVLVGFLFGWVIRLNLSVAFGVPLISNVVGILGDLAESVLKRFFGKKDSSNLIPGHGGILDRLDSFAFATLFVYLFLKWKILLF